MAPIKLPNVLIYLSSVVRPGLLKPDLRVPSIAHIDFRALRREGYNAVVIDKDNCLTLPNKDDIYPPYQTAWNDLLETFRPGRVLVVSNSAGTKKDPGGIAAESVSLSLQAPVLLHAQPKPGCSPTILSYFSGKLGTPTTRRREIRLDADKVWEEEKADERGLWKRWEGEVEGPLLGTKAQSGLGKEHREGDKSVKLEKKAKTGSKGNAGATTSGKLTSDTKHDQGPKAKGEVLRILVIGDRLFTDTLLAHRLRLYLPKPPKDQLLPSVLSIHTSSLPEPNDVRPLRWIEDRLTRGLIKTYPGSEGLSRFILSEPESHDVIPSPSSEPSSLSARIRARFAALRWLTPSRWREFDETIEPLTYHPRSWRPLPLAAGLVRSIGRSTRFFGRYGKKGAQLGWIRGKNWIKERRDRRQLASGSGASVGTGTGTGVIPGLAQGETSVLVQRVKEGQA